MQFVPEKQENREKRWGWVKNEKKRLGHCCALEIGRLLLRLLNLLVYFCIRDRDIKIDTSFVSLSEV